MPIEIAVQPDDYTTPGRPAGDDASSPIWCDLIRSNGGVVREVDVRRSDILEQLRGVDGFLWRWPHWGPDYLIARRLIPVVEFLYGIPVFPDVSTCWHYDDKAAQKFIFESCGIPTPKTWLFFDEKEAREWAGTATYPVVLKLAKGASSSNVRLIGSKSEAIGWIRRLFSFGATSLGDDAFMGRASEQIPPGFRVRTALRAAVKGQLPGEWRHVSQPIEFGYAYFQEFLPDNGYDTRVTVIGNRAFGFRRFNRKDDFRASGSGNFDLDQTRVDPAFIHLAFEVAEKSKSESCAIDGLYRNGEPVVVEMSYTFSSWAINDCPGSWVRSGGRLEWREGHLRPEVPQFDGFWSKVVAATRGKTR